MNETRNFIDNIFLFGNLENTVKEHIAGFCSRAEYKKGTHIFHEGDEAVAFYYVISGKVKIYKLSGRGQEQTLEIIGNGNLVAEAAIFDLATYPAYCMTLEKTTLLRIPRTDFLELIERNSRVALKIMHAYSKRLRYFVSLVEKLSMQDIRSRLARYILETMTEKDGQAVCKIPVTKKELAALLGTVPETLSRALRSLKDDGIIEEKGRRLLIVKKSALRNLI